MYCHRFANVPLPLWNNDVALRSMDRPLAGHGELSCRPLHTDDPTTDEVLAGHGMHEDEETFLLYVPAGQGVQVSDDPEPFWSDPVMQMHWPVVDEKVL